MKRILATLALVVALALPGLAQAEVNGVYFAPKFLMSIQDTGNISRPSSALSDESYSQFTLGGALTDPLVPAVMIAGTVLGLALSFVPKVRNVKENSAAGHYLILVFSFALASSLDLGTLGENLLHTVALLASITVCSALLHLLLCRIFRIGADCAIVTMTAGLYGPAFIPAVTKQLRCDALTAPGLICGALGYAVGTFLGAALFWIL